jgi:hypothetical protein
MTIPRRIVAGVAIVVGLGAAVGFGIGLSEALAVRRDAAVTAIGSARIEQMLGPRDFAALGGPIGRDLGVTHGGAVVFQTGAVLRVVDPARAPLPEANAIALSAVPDSFALDPGGTMLTVSGGYFGMLDENGDLVQGIPLPSPDVQLAPSVHEGATYLFGKSGDHHRLYRFIDDGTLQVLLESGQPIVAAADGETAMFAATSSAILRIKAGAPETLFTAPDDFAGPIRSLAVTADGIVLFATDARVYALLGPDALSIVNDAGGSIRVRDGSLYVLDPTRRLLFRLHPASAQLFAEVSR